MAKGEVERARLLSLVKDYLLEKGMVNLSLSELARSIGSNNRMILYYFGSLHGVLTEAIDAIIEEGMLRSRLREILKGNGSFEQRLNAAWRHIADPARLPNLEVFFARFGMAVDSADGFERFFEHARNDWAFVVAETLRDEGYTTDTHEKAVAVVALWRGLQISLLSGEPKTVVARSHRQLIAALLAGWATESAVD